MQSLQPTTLASFHQFIGQQLASESAAQISPELALAMWRERQDAVAAIREGLADVDAGLATLQDDLRSGAWDRKNRSLRQQDDLDLGYRLIVAPVRSNTRE